MASGPPRSPHQSRRRHETSIEPCVSTCEPANQGVLHALTKNQGAGRLKVCTGVWTFPNGSLPPRHKMISCASPPWALTGVWTFSRGSAARSAVRLGLTGAYAKPLLRGYAAVPSLIIRGLENLIPFHESCGCEPAASVGFIQQAACAVAACEPLNTNHRLQSRHESYTMRPSYRILFTS
jgi:hypothetical protein